jgi:hypothetical protein
MSKKTIKVCASPSCESPWQQKGKKGTTVRAEDGYGERTCLCGWMGMALWKAVPAPEETT